MADAVWRVRDRASFDMLRRSGRRARSGRLTVTWVAGAPDDPTRVAYAISRRVGGAVLRNRLRRRLRAAVSELRGQLSPGTYLLSAAPGAAELSYGELRGSLSHALAVLARPAGRR